MRVNEKWMLFLIATFVSFFGIVDTLLKRTEASEIVMNSYFNDVNFYRCIVDSYNQDNNTDIDYSTSLTDSQM